MNNVLSIQQDDAVRTGDFQCFGHMLHFIASKHFAHGLNGELRNGSGFGIHSLLERLGIQDPLPTTRHAIFLSVGYKTRGTNWRISSEFQLVEVQIKVQKKDLITVFDQGHATTLCDTQIPDQRENFL